MIVYIYKGLENVRIRISPIRKDKGEFFMGDGENTINFYSIPKKTLREIRDKLNKMNLGGDINVSDIKLKGAETKTGYKVVSVGWGDELFSAVLEYVGRLDYPIGKRVYRELKNGAIAVFNTLLNALEFLESHFFEGEYRIYKCEYRPAKIDELYTTDFDYTSVPYKIDRVLNDFPKGTRLARWVKLKKLVHREECEL